MVPLLLSIVGDGAAGTVANDGPQDGRLLTAQELRGLASQLLRLLLELFGETTASVGSSPCPLACTLLGLGWAPALLGFKENGGTVDVP